MVWTEIQYNAMQCNTIQHRLYWLLRLLDRRPAAEDYLLCHTWGPGTPTSYLYCCVSYTTPATHPAWRWRMRASMRWIQQYPYNGYSHLCHVRLWPFNRSVLVNSFNLCWLAAVKSRLASLATQAVNATGLWCELQTKASPLICCRLIVEHCEVVIPVHLIWCVIIIYINGTKLKFRRDWHVITGLRANMAQCSVLPRLLLQGAVPCPLFVTPCPFEKAEMTPCPFFFFLEISVTYGF